MGRVAYTVLVGVLLAGPISAQTPTASEPGFQVVRGTFLALQVADLTVVADWYAAVFGLAEVNRIEAEDDRYAIRILRGRGLTVELIRQRDVVASESTPLGLFKAGFHVDDLDALRRRLETLEADVDAGTFFDEALGVRSFVFRDPEGNRLQAFGR